MAADNPITRKCPRCSAAFLSARKKSGYCPPCTIEYRKEWYLRNKEKVISLSKQWRAKNRERYLENNKKYYNANKASISEKQREYQKKNMDRHLERSAIWREKNIEKARDNEARYRARNRDICNARIREWKSNNKEKTTLYATSRGRRVRQATPKWANFKRIREIYAFAASMRKATGVNYQVDHIVPLISTLVCGLHCEANLRIVTQEENLRKLNRTWPDMP